MARGMCSRCREKPREQGTGFCRDCRSAYNREYRARMTPEQRAAYDRKPRSPEQNRARNLKQSFGITVDEYETLFERQGGVCAICGIPPGTKPLCVDHDHSTDAIRGLLCNNCNTLLGMSGDRVEVLQKAIEYLVREPVNV